MNPNREDWAMDPFRTWLSLLAAAALLVAGCPAKEPDDDTASDDDDDDDDTGDDDTTPVEICTQTPNGADLDATVCAEDAACTLAQVGQSTFQGFSLAADGDFDGDGVADIVVGAPGYDGIQDEGRAWIYTLASLDELVPAPVAYLEGDDSLEYAGYRVGYIGDLDGDGSDDVLVGARGDADGGEAAGAIYVVHGQPLTGTVDAPQALEPDAAIRGEREYSRVGVSASGVWDATGDGTAELAIAHALYQDYSGYEYQDDGGVVVFHGRAGGLPADQDITAADLQLTAPDDTSQVGYGLAGRGDIDGDGLGDLIVGAPHASTGRGLVYVIPAATIAAGGVLDIGDAAAVTIEGSEINDHLGEALAYVGDVDGDGIDDLAAGAPDSDVTWPDGGAVFLFKGAAEVATGAAPDTLAVIGSEWDDFSVGGAFAGRGDVDGDGLGDLVVAGTYALLGPIMKGGRAYLFHGRTSGWDELTDVTEAAAGIAGVGVGDNLGTGLALGDVDGDGVDDLIIGAPYRDSAGSDSGEVYLFWGPTR